MGEYYFPHIGGENIIFHTLVGQIIIFEIGVGRRSFSIPWLGESFFLHLHWEKIIFHTLVGRILFTSGWEKIMFATYTTYYVVTPSNRVLIISTLQVGVVKEYY